VFLLYVNSTRCIGGFLKIVHAQADRSALASEPSAAFLSQLLVALYAAIILEALFARRARLGDWKSKIFRPLPSPWPPVVFRQTLYSLAPSLSTDFQRYPGPAGFRTQARFFEGIMRNAG
jgi:hypothetical protein